MEAFGKYVPLTVVQGLLGGTILPRLGMEERSLAVGFMDVEDFTALCETDHDAVVIGCRHRVATKVTEMVAATSRLFDMCCDRIAESKGTARGGRVGRGRVWTVMRVSGWVQGCRGLVEGVGVRDGGWLCQCCNLHDFRRPGPIDKFIGDCARAAASFHFIPPSTPPLQRAAPASRPHHGVLGRPRGPPPRRPPRRGGRPRDPVPGGPWIPASRCLCGRRSVRRIGPPWPRRVWRRRRWSSGSATACSCGWGSTTGSASSGTSAPRAAGTTPSWGMRGPARVTLQC